MKEQKAAAIHRLKYEPRIDRIISGEKLAEELKELKKKAERIKEKFKKKNENASSEIRIFTGEQNEN